MVTMPEEHGGRDDAAVRWDMILNELKPALPRATFETWLKPTRGIEWNHTRRCNLVLKRSRLHRDAGPLAWCS